MRLFVAIEAPPEWRKIAEGVQRSLSDRFGDAIRPVAPENMHITLRFIGEVDDLATPRLKEALASRLPPIEVRLELDGVRTFGAAAHTSSAWLSVAGDVEGLRDLHDRTNEAVDDALGVPFEEQRYKPHLTLARVRNRASAEDRRALAEYVRQIEAPSSELFIAREVSLIRSRRSGSGPHYETLATCS